jgi:hypothetical protein
LEDNILADDPLFGSGPPPGPPSDPPSDDPPFGPDELAPVSPDEDPEARSWLFVLTRAVTVNRDQLLVLESDGRQFIPAFRDRAEARGFKSRLAAAGGGDDGPDAGDLADQAMHLVDVRRTAGEMGLRILVLSGEGAVLDALDAAGC